MQHHNTAEQTVEERLEELERFGLTPAQAQAAVTYSDALKDTPTKDEEK